MIAKTYILQNLAQLDIAYQRAKNQKNALFFSKLAILELCGWIEMSMDDLVLSHCNRHVLDPANLKYMHDDIVKKNYGFDYKRNFRRMLISLVGIVTCEKLEATIPVAVHSKFVAQLTSLKTIRNGLAHTYLKGPPGTIQIDAPSATRVRFADIHSGLIEYQKRLQALKKAHSSQQ